MVESTSGILAIGGFDNNWNEVNNIYRWSCKSETNCEWIQAGELNTARHLHVVIPISSDLAKTLTSSSSSSSSIFPLLQPLFDFLGTVKMFL